MFNSQRICAQLLYFNFARLGVICAFIFNFLRICAQVLCSSFLICMGFVPACSILVEYVHKLSILTCLTIS